MRRLIICVLFLTSIQCGSIGDSKSNKVGISNNRAAEILNKLKNPSGDYVLVVSHRGDWRYAPENSLQAVQRCIDLGVDIVEIDMRLTKDGHLVAMHDKTVDRTTQWKGTIK